MTLAIAFRPEAEREVEVAYGWYEERWPGLGDEFLWALGSAIMRAARNPLLYPCVARRTHRVVLRRFPYLVFYVVEEHRLVVTGVFHGHRDPGDWADRVREKVLRYRATSSSTMVTRRGLQMDSARSDRTIPRRRRSFLSSPSVHPA